MSAPQQSLLSGVKPLPSRERPCCPACKQRLPQVFKHTLSRGLISGLWKLYHAGKAAGIGELDLTNNEFANFQKLRYFDLTVSMGGQWSVSQRGFLFLGNRLEIERAVFTRNGRVVERSEVKIRVVDVDEGWMTKLDYARESRIA